MQDLISRLVTYPLVPGVLLLCWLGLELLAVRRLRRDGRKRKGTE